MSPEAILDLRFSEFSDVWAMSVTFWEIFTLGKVPYSDQANWSQDFLKELMEGVQVLPKPNLCSDPMYKSQNDFKILDN